MSDSEFCTSPETDQRFSRINTPPLLPEHKKKPEKSSKSKPNKQANPNRFKNITEQHIDEAKLDARAKNTIKQTSWSANLFKGN